MALVYSPKVIEIAVIATISGKPHVNVWHMYHDAEGFGPDAEAIVEDFRDNWQDHVMDLPTSQYVLQRFEWRSLDPGSNVVGTVLPDPNKATTGASVSTPCPPNVSYLIHKRTPNRPRGRRDGRSFLAGIPEDYVEPDGSLLTALVTASNTSLTAFYNGISDTSLNWAGDAYPVVLETTEASRAPGSAAVVIGSRRVTSIFVDPVVATQRDRLR